MKNAVISYEDSDWIFENIPKYSLSRQRVFPMIKTRECLNLSSEPACEKGDITEVRRNRKQPSNKNKFFFLIAKLPVARCQVAVYVTSH